MKILLINPPGKVSFISPPLGLLYVGSSLKEAGYDVSVIDFNIQNYFTEQITQKIKKENISIVGISIVTPKVYEAIKLASDIRKNFPKIIIIAGGPHSTLMPEQLMKDCPAINYTILGEGEKRTVELVRCLKNNLSLTGMDGIAYRKNNEIAVNPISGFIEGMDTLPMPARELVDIFGYSKLMKTSLSPATTMMTSRGCPYQCIYCSKPVTGANLRAMSPERVLKEIESLVKNYSIKEIIFYDDSFTLNKERAHKICDLIIEKGIKIKWQCETRVNLVDEELLKKMARAGCYLIAYGIESGSDRVLGILKKGINTEQVRKAVGITNKAGIGTIGYFMLGIPGETEDEIKQTINFAKELDINFAQFSIATAYPGTELYNIAEKQNKITSDWSKSIYALGGKPIISLSDIPIDTLYKYTKKAYRSFYFRPSYIWKRVTSIRSLNDLKYNTRGLITLLGL